MFGNVRTLFFSGMLGKLLGVVRELLSAALFGTGPVAVSYRLAQAAFLIPLHGFLSETFGAGFTPEYARNRVQDVRRARALFAAMHAIALIVSALVGAAVAFFAADWVRLLAPGFNSSTAALTTRMVQWMALAMPLYALTNLYASAQLASGKASVASARASAQSIGLIVGALLIWRSGDPLM